MIKFRSGDVYLVREPFYLLNVRQCFYRYKLYKIKKISLENTIEVERILITNYTTTNYRDCIYLRDSINIDIDSFLSRIEEKVPKIIWYKIIRRIIIKNKSDIYQCHDEQFKGWGYFCYIKRHGL